MILCKKKTIFLLKNKCDFLQKFFSHATLDKMFSYSSIDKSIVKTFYRKPICIFTANESILDLVKLSFYKTFQAAPLTLSQQTLWKQTTKHATEGAWRVGRQQRQQRRKHTQLGQNMHFVTSQVCFG